MPEYKRVRENGWEYSIPVGRVTDGVEVLDKPATAPSGRPLPPKPVTALGDPAPGSKKDRERAQKTTRANGSGEDAGQKSAAPEQEN